MGLVYVPLAITATYYIGTWGGAIVSVASMAAIATTNPDLPAAFVINTLIRIAVFGLVVGITHQIKRTTAALEESKRQLQREFDTSSEYTAVVSHELRNPLVAIQAAARTLPSQPEPHLIARAIAAEAGSAMSLLEAMNEVSGLESGRLRSALRRVDLTATVRGALDIREGDARLTTSGLDTPISVMGDPERLAQVVKNLVSNAIKYSPEDAPIDVTLGVSPDRREAVVGVRDHGPGIRPSERPMLFEKFKRLSTAGGTRGSGLGLYICKRIIEDHGGRLEAEFPSGGGTRFVFSVPVAA